MKISVTGIESRDARMELRGWRMDQRYRDGNWKLKNGMYIDVSIAVRGYIMESRRMMEVRG
jgi:hypothetical protein